MARALHNRAFRLLLIGGCTLPVWIGCGGGSSGDTVHWAGEVTLDGSPLPAGTQGAITIRPMETKNTRPITVYLTEGKFDSPDVPRGKVKAFFSLDKPTGKTVHSERTGQDVEEMVSIVPADAMQGIDLEVAGDDTNVKIDL